MWPPKYDPVSLFFLFIPSVEAPKEERPELQKKTYKWNTKEEAKQAFKELLKEKVSWPACQIGLTPRSSDKGCAPLESDGTASTGCARVILDLTFGWSP